MTNKISAKAQMPNPALKILQPLVGEWRTTGEHPFVPEKPLHGRAMVEWIEGGAFLLMRSEIDHPQFPQGISIFGSDDGAGALYILYFDERGISRKYDVSIRDKKLTWRREDAKFSQRFTMTIGEDQLESHGEMSREGGDWETDLSLTYTRI